MAREITVQEFNSLLGVDVDLGLLNAQTFVLNDFGAPETGQVEDDNGFFEVGDGSTTFNGDPVTYIGSGTAQFGISAGGGLLGGLLGGVLDVVNDLVGDPVPVTVFEAGGRVLVFYPEGEPPSLLGLDNLLVTFDLEAAPAPIPCFLAGTMILTPDGERPVEDIAAGDLVLDEDGVAHPAVWVGSRTLHLPTVPGAARHLPIRIPAGTFGAGRPHTDLFLSPQHRIALDGAAVELFSGEGRGLAAVCHIIGDRVRVDRRRTRIAYHHILCARHVLLVANGLPCESMLIGPMMLELAEVDPTWEEIRDIFPELGTPAARARGMRPALPILTRREAALSFRSLS